MSRTSQIMNLRCAVACSSQGLCGMAKAKIDRVGLFWVLFWFLVLGALYYFGYTTEWGAHLLNAFGILMLFWGFLSPLYVLIRMVGVYYRGKKAAKLGLTYAEYEAQRRAKLGLSSPAAPGVRHELFARWERRLLHIKRWELVTFTVLLVLFGVLAQQWRQVPGEHVKVSALGMFYAVVLYAFLGVQVLHRVWAHWHHRLVPGSVAPVEASPEQKLSPGQIGWNAACLSALLFAVAELALSGEGEMMAVLFSLIAPAFLLLLFASLWRMLRPMFRHRHTEAA